MVTGGATLILGHSDRLFPVLAFWMVPWVYAPSKMVVVLVGDPVGVPPGWAAGSAAAAGGADSTGAHANTARNDIPNRNDCFI